MRIRRLGWCLCVCLGWMSGCPGGAQTELPQAEKRTREGVTKRELVSEPSHDAGIATVERRSERRPEQRPEPRVQPEPGPESSPEKQPESALSADTTKRLQAFFDRHGGKTRFSASAIEVLTAFLTVEELYFTKRYQEAWGLLTKLWAKYPVGDLKWRQIRLPNRAIHLGSPLAYYGLRMLTEMVQFRLRAKTPSTPAQITMTVVLVDCLTGTQPTTMQELNEGKGKPVKLSLNPGLRAQNDLPIRQSLRLFLAYIHDITRGRLKVDVNIQSVKGCAEGVTSVKPYRIASLRSAQDVLNQVPAAVRAKTSWWWVIYPSFVPDQYPDFKTTEFISGGMGLDATTGAPCFIINDAWLLRKPPHLGAGPYTQIERRVYLPQWLQHEFYHHLYRSYPSFELEKKGHQWFDRRTWPVDFVGRFEPDYYAESLTKRLQTSRAQPPLHIKLRYEQAPASVFQSLPEAQILGRYKRLPVTNGFHDGVIQKDLSGAYVWRNKSGVSWTLAWSPGQAGLATDKSCPYYGKPGAEQFKLELKRGSNGDYTPVVSAFRFLGERYVKQP